MLLMQVARHACKLAHLERIREHIDGVIKTMLDVQVERMEDVDAAEVEIPLDDSVGDAGRGMAIGDDMTVRIPECG